MALQPAPAPGLPGLLRAAGTLLGLVVGSAALASSAADSDRTDEERYARGRYLVEAVADCQACHTRRLPPDFAIALAPELAGGVKISSPWGVFFTPNITPAIRTGIAAYTEDEFIRRMREGVKRDGLQMLMNYMPWYACKKMTDADLKAIYAYLMSVEPIENDIYRTENQFPLGN